jgi:hypothetical protein
LTSGTYITLCAPVLQIAQRQDAAGGVERELGVDRLVAALVVGEERLAAVAGPFDRPADALRRPGDQAEFRKERVAGAEIAADVARRHPHLFLGHVQDGGELALLPHHAARAGVQEVAAGRRVVGADRRTRVERHAGHPVHQRVEPDDVGGARERRHGAGRVADVGVDAHVGDVVVEPDGLRRDRGLAGDDGSQRPVVDRDALGGVARLGHRLGHHHGDLLADVAHPVGGEHGMRRVAVRRAVAVPELDVGRRLHRDRRVRDRLDAVGLRVDGGEHREHARHRARLGGVDRADARMSVRRAHERRVGLPRQADVVAEPPAAGEQAEVFLAAERLTDGGRHGGGAYRHFVTPR